MRTLERGDVSCCSAEVALGFAHAAKDDGDMYFAYLWLLVAVDAGSDEAEDLAEELYEAGSVTAEEVTQVHYQLASWYHTGSHVTEDARWSLEHLVQAARNHGLRHQRKLLSSLPPADALRKVGAEIGVLRDSSPEA